MGETNWKESNQNQLKMPSSDTYFTKENAREMQKKSQQKKAENAERRRLLREVLADELAKPISKDSTMTKLEWLVMKMVQNVKDEIKPQDLKLMQDMLGESSLKVEMNTRKPEDIMKEIVGELEL